MCNRLFAQLTVFVGSTGSYNPCMPASKLAESMFTLLYAYIVCHEHFVYIWWFSEFLGIFSFRFPIYYSLSFVCFWTVRVFVHGAADNRNRSITLAWPCQSSKYRNEKFLSRSWIIAQLNCISNLYQSHNTLVVRRNRHTAPATPL